MKLLLTLTATLVGTATVFAEPLTFESEDTPATLVELFTSEGCSSCPAADAWISKLKMRPDLWKRVVPVVFHVDYWDRLGWPDRFATAANTARQSRYAAIWRSNSIYTPGFVLNGREWRGWSPGEALSEPSAARVGKLTIVLGGIKADVVFAPVRTAPKTLRVEVALLGIDLNSDVKSGENRGRKLHHDFTVLHQSSTPLRANGDRLVATVPVPSKAGDAPKAIAAWITAGDAQPPIQATGGWLTKVQR